jgi:hypothetical protein
VLPIIHSTLSPGDLQNITDAYGTGPPTMASLKPDGESLGNPGVSAERTTLGLWANTYGSTGGASDAAPTAAAGGQWPVASTLPPAQLPSGKAVAGSTHTSLWQRLTHVLRPRGRTAEKYAAPFPLTPSELEGGLQAAMYGEDGSPTRGSPTGRRRGPGSMVGRSRAAGVTTQTPPRAARSTPQAVLGGCAAAALGLTASTPVGGVLVGGGTSNTSTAAGGTAGGTITSTAAVGSPSSGAGSTALALSGAGTLASALSLAPTTSTTSLPLLVGAESAAMGSGSLPPTNTMALDGAGSTGGLVLCNATLVQGDTGPGSKGGYAPPADSERNSGTSMYSAATNNVGAAVDIVRWAH